MPAGENPLDRCVADAGDLEQSLDLRQDAVLIFMNRRLGRSQQLRHLPLPQALALPQKLDARADDRLVE